MHGRALLDPVALPLVRAAHVVLGRAAAGEDDVEVARLARDPAREERLGRRRERGEERTLLVRLLDGERFGSDLWGGRLGAKVD